MYVLCAWPAFGYTECEGFLQGWPHPPKMFAIEQSTCDNYACLSCRKSWPDLDHCFQWHRTRCLGLCAYWRTIPRESTEHELYVLCFKVTASFESSIFSNKNLLYVLCFKVTASFESSIFSHKNLLYVLCFKVIASFESSIFSNKKSSSHVRSD